MKLNINPIQTAAITVAAALFLSGCASKLDKAAIPATSNPSEVYAGLETSYADATKANVDVLAPKEYDKGASYLEEAREDLKDGEDQAEILESLAYATSYLQKASEIAEGRRGHVPTLLEARTNAINAGAWKSENTSKTLKKLDAEVEDASERLDKELSAERITYLERAYLGLEMQAIQNNLLGSAKSRIEGSKEMGASKRAPQTLKQAEVDFRAAETAIGTNVKAPENYNEAVAKANASSQYLVDVLAAVEKNGKGTTEAVARQLVDQNQKIGSLEGYLSRAQNKVSALGKTVNEQSKALTLQQALDSARKSFSPSEAEVFQQGRNLVIRLKTMNFPSGRSELSQESIDILSKVTKVMGSLPSEKIVVEGHTDSVGAAALNQKLSAERAETVAKYLESNAGIDKEITAVGYGFKKPIASNKNKLGRSQNRRVDVVISAAPGDTPSAATSKSMENLNL